MSVWPRKTKISLGIHPVWSKSLLCAQWVANDPSFLHTDSEDSDLTGRMPRLIWVFAGRTLSFCWFCHEAAQIFVINSHVWCGSTQVHLMRSTSVSPFSPSGNSTQPLKYTYHKQCKYWDISNHCCNHPKIWKGCPNGKNPDLGLHCLSRTVCLKTGSLWYTSLKWATSRENLSSGGCNQVWLKSACSAIEG